MLGDVIKVLRTENKITQSNLARSLGVRPSTISMWEQNRRTPDINLLKNISDFFNVSTDYLLEKTNIRNYETKETTVVLHTKGNRKMITLGDRIKDLRKSNNLTQAELGKILGVGKTTVSMYETNNSTPNDDIKLKMCEYFNVSLDYLVGKSNIKQSADSIIDSNPKENTVALHTDDYDELPQEAKDEINNFIDYIKQKYKK